MNQEKGRGTNLVIIATMGKEYMWLPVRVQLLANGCSSRALTAPLLRARGRGSGLTELQLVLTPKLGLFAILGRG